MRPNSILIRRRPRAWRTRSTASQLEASRPPMGAADTSLHAERKPNIQFLSSSSSISQKLYSSSLSHATTTTESFEDALSASSPTTLIGANKKDDAVLQQRMLELCNAPEGSLTREEWKEAVQLVQAWTNKGSNLEDTRLSFTLLDRFHHDAEGLSFSESNGDNANFVHITLALNVALENWHQCGKQLLLDTKDLTPQKMLDRVDSYTTSLGLRPDTKTYGILMDAQVRRMVQSSLEAEAVDQESSSIVDSSVDFVQSLFDRMLREVHEGKLSPPLDAVLHNILMNVYCQAGLASQAQAVLDSITLNVRKDDDVDDDDNNNKNAAAATLPVFPDVTSFSTVISAWSRSNHPQAPERAEAILRRMVDHTLDGSLSHVKPNVISYSSVLSCWANSGRPEAGERVETLLAEMERDPSIQPNTISYNTALHAWARLGETKKAENLLQRMLKQQRRNNNIQPDLHSFNTVLAAMARSSSTTDVIAERAEAILRQLKDSPELPFPDIVSFNTVLHCWANSGARNAGERAEALLKYMENDQDNDTKPDTVSYSTVINAWARLGNPDRAEAIIKHMIENNQAPNVHCFAAVLRAWSNSSQHNHASPDRAEALFKQMLDLGIPANVECYNSLLHCWASSRQRGAGERAEALLVEMESLSRSLGAAVKPDVISYSTVINAWARKGNTQRAESLLQRMFDEYHRGNYSVRPNLHAFNTVLAAWARSSDGNAPEKAENILKQMKDFSAVEDDNSLYIRPDLISYNTVLTCWARSRRKGAGRRAQNILEEMREIGNSENSTIKPDVLSYNTVITAWSVIGDMEQGERLLQQMLYEYRQGNDRVRPNANTFSALLKACSRSKDPLAPERAEAILKQMEDLATMGFDDLRPGIVIYNGVLNCWATSDRAGAGERAEAFLWKIQGRSDMEPDTISYSTTMKAWARAGNAQRAESLLEKMLTEYRSGNDGVKPNLHAFNTVLKAWSRSQQYDAPERVEFFLKRMEDLDIAPDVVSYNTLLYCWTNSGRRGGIERAEAILCDMESHSEAGNALVKPDDISYKTVMRAWSLSGNRLRAKALEQRMLLASGG